VFLTLAHVDCTGSVLVDYMAAAGREIQYWDFGGLIGKSRTTGKELRK